jgi:hypothetical protein
MQNKQLQELIMSGRKKLVDEHLLNSNVLSQPIQLKSAYEADNFDWRYLTAAEMM